MGKHLSKAVAYVERKRGFKEPDLSNGSVYLTPPSQLGVSKAAVVVCAARPFQPPPEKGHRPPSVSGQMSSKCDAAPTLKAPNSPPPGIRSSDAGVGKRASVASAAESESVEDGSVRSRLLLGMIYVSIAVLLILIAEFYLFASLSKLYWARHRKLRSNGSIEENGPTTLSSEARNAQHQGQKTSVKIASSSRSEDTIETERFEEDRSTSMDDILQVSSGNYSVTAREYYNNSDEHGHIK